MRLIVESGSTKTQWSLLRPKEAKPLSLSSEGINPYYAKAEEIQAAQSKVWEALQGQDIRALHYFGTGIVSEKEKDIIQSVFQTQFPGLEQIEIASDLVGAGIALCGHEPGLVCILGTGSNSGFFDGKEISHQVPPLGFWLGDEGSGGHLGKQLILAYWHQSLSPELRNSFEKRYGVLDRASLLQKAYQEPYPNRWFAGFAKFLFDHRRAPEVYAMITASFDAFIQNYLDRYPQGKSEAVHALGGIAFYFSDMLKKRLQYHGYRMGRISEEAMPGLNLFYKGVSL